MSAILVYYDNNNQLDELKQVFNEFSNWKFLYFQAKNSNFEDLEKCIISEEINFFICTKVFSQNIAKSLYYLHAHYPLLTIIYFNSFLSDNEFSEFFRAGVKYCIIGEKRQVNLHNTLHKLIDNHWKRIPENILKYDRNAFPERARIILKYIETTPIKKCNTENIAEFLEISQSHFRKEFRTFFGINFREFKQRLLSHYEDVLLFDKNLKPGHIYKLLDYKNLSAFSRSFKARHGVSWQNLVKTKD